MAEEAESRSSAAPSDADDGNGAASGNGERDEQAPDGERARSEPQRQSGTGGGRDEQNVSAPSLGPNTVIEREPVEERLARHDQSEEDAMGLDKRRPVVGQSYGPSKARQFALYGIVLAAVAALGFGGYLLVNAEDKGVGKDVPNNAPWSKPGAKQIPPKPIQ